jgi:hypothetical protein
VAVCVTGFTFSGGAENSGNVVITFHIRALCEVQVTAIGLGFTGESVFEVLFGLGAFKGHDISYLCRLMKNNGLAVKHSPGFLIVEIDFNNKPDRSSQ